MSRKTQLMLASVAFAVIWTAAMYWWLAVKDIVGATILLLEGTIVGLGWYFGMRMWSRWYFGRQWD